jgi:hypothetical protein
MRERNGCSMPDARHFELGKALLHAPGHLQTGLRIGAIAPGLGIAEEDQHGIADELVDGAAIIMSDRRHLREIFVEELRQLLRLQPFGRGREIRRSLASRYGSVVGGFVANSRHLRQEMRRHRAQKTRVGATPIMMGRGEVPFRFMTNV